ncbi:MAG: c-type cytochrome, partial [Planctomycetales bacterium]
GWPKGTAVKLSDGTEADLEKLLPKLSPGVQGLFVKLARGWGSDRFDKHAQQVATSLLRQLDDAALGDPQRIAAARQFIEFQPVDQQAVAELIARVSPQTSPDLAAGVIGALRSSESPAAGKLLVARLPRLTPRTRAAGITVLLARPQMTKALLGALDQGVVQLGELSLDQKQSLAAHPDKSIRDQARKLLNRGGALPNPDRQKVLAALLPITQQTGDPAAGKVVFTKQCAKCHQHGGEGTRIGPDLTGMAVHPKAALLGHIIDPSRNVEGNYRVYTVQTADGLVLSGLLASESKTAIEIFDAEGKKKTVLREDVDQIIASPKSLMPDGFEKQATPKEIGDLLEFLTQRGKFVPLDLAKVATITSVRGMFLNKEASVERLIFPDWSPKKFKGVPFHLTDPQDGKTANVILLHGPNGPVCAKMPKSVRLPCNGPVRAIHLLSGVSGWGFPYSRDESTSMIVRLHY